VTKHFCDVRNLDLSSLKITLQTNIFGIHIVVVHKHIRINGPPSVSQIINTTFQVHNMFVMTDILCCEL